MIQRYGLRWEWMEEDPKGEYVTYNDYKASTKALREALRRSLELVKALLQSPDEGRFDWREFEYQVRRIRTTIKETGAPVTKRKAKEVKDE